VLCLASNQLQLVDKPFLGSQGLLAGLLIIISISLACAVSCVIIVGVTRFILIDVILCIIAVVIL
jgi:hypothetical protein